MNKPTTVKQTLVLTLSLLLLAKKTPHWSSTFDFHYSPLHNEVAKSAFKSKNYTKESCHFCSLIENITPDIYLNIYLVDIFGHTNKTIEIPTYIKILTNTTLN